MKLREQIKTELELTIDQIGVYNVLSMIADIAYEKSEHIRSNYDDIALSKSWDTIGNRIDTVKARIKRQSDHVAGLI